MQFGQLSLEYVNFCILLIVGFDLMHIISCKIGETESYPVYTWVGSSNSFLLCYVQSTQEVS